jgi:hypothetical protein
MSRQAATSVAGDGLPGASRPPLAGRLGALRAYLSACIATCADYYEAATLYDELSGLSEAELCRRGLSRATLGWEIAQACDRAKTGRDGPRRTGAGQGLKQRPACR